MQRDPESGAPAPPSPKAPPFLGLLEWGYGRLVRGLARCTAGLTCAGGANRVRTLLACLMLALTLAGAAQVAPLVYGRFALTYEAAHLARSWRARSQEEAVRILTRTAFR